MQKTEVPVVEVGVPVLEVAVQPNKGLGYLIFKCI